VLCLRSKFFFDYLRFMALFKFRYKFLLHKASSIIQANHTHTCACTISAAPNHLALLQGRFLTRRNQRQDRRSTALLKSGQRLGASAAAAPGKASIAPELGDGLLIVGAFISADGTCALFSPYSKLTEDPPLGLCPL